MPDELAAWIQKAFDPHGERTARAGFYWPGADAEPGTEPKPTASGKS